VTPLYPDRAKTDPVYFIDDKDLETRIGKVLADAQAGDEHPRGEITVTPTPSAHHPELKSNANIARWAQLPPA
jgi:hypothetical protein